MVQYCKFITYNFVIIRNLKSPSTFFKIYIYYMWTLYGQSSSRFMKLCWSLFVFYFLALPIGKARNHSRGNCVSKLWISCGIVVVKNLLTLIHICICSTRHFNYNKAPECWINSLYTVEIRCQYIVNGSEISFILKRWQNPNEKNGKQPNLFCCQIVKFKARVNSVAWFLRITFRFDAWCLIECNSYEKSP